MFNNDKIPYNGVSVIDNISVTITVTINAMIPLLQVFPLVLKLFYCIFR